MKITIRTYHDCRSRLLDAAVDSCPVKLVVYFNKKRKYFDIVKRNGEQLKLTKTQYSQATTERPRGEAKKARALIDAEISRARQIVENMQGFDMAQFERAFTGNMAGLSLTVDMQEIAGDMKKSSKNVYLHALKSLADYLKKKTVDYSDLTPRVITDFVKHMEKSLSADTIKTYMGAIKAAVSRAKKFGELPEDYNPFRAYEAPKGAKRQLLLSVAQFDTLQDYQPKTDAEQFAKDVFLFCTLCNGQYTATVFRLKTSDIVGQWISFKRHKTKDKSNQRLQAYVSDTMQEIISRYDGEYIFPVLSQKGDPEQLISNARQRVNKGLKKIAKQVKAVAFPVITVKYCRGTYAEVGMKRGGLTFAEVSRNMGHSNIGMTEHYNDGRNLDAIEEAAKKIG